MISRQPTTKKQAEFVMRPTWWFRTDLKPTAREVLTVLVSYLPYGAQSGVVFPSVATIADDANIGCRTAYEALHELESAGLITMKKRPGDYRHRNEYRIHEMSQQQIEALCRRKETRRQAEIPADSAHTYLQNPQKIPAESAHEEEQEKENQRTRIGLDWTGPAPSVAGAVAKPGKVACLQPSGLRTE